MALEVGHHTIAKDMTSTNYDDSERSQQSFKGSSKKDDTDGDSSDALTDFSDLEVNLDNDDLFCDNEDTERVKQHVEESLYSLGTLGEASLDTNLFEFQDDSDELFTASESGDDEHIPQNNYQYFNKKTGFCKDMQLDKGLQCRNKNVFNKALRYYAIINSFDFYYVTNLKGKVSAHCKVVHCPWRVLASWFNDKTGCKSFMIKTWVPHKDCPRSFQNSKVTAKFLTEHYLESFRINHKWEVAAFFLHVKDDLQVNVSHMKCFRARQDALKIIDGSVGEQFKLLRQYCGAMLKWCPGSSIVLKTDISHFQRVYMCLDACKRGFLTGCRSIINLDSCHLKGHYNRQINYAVGRDANDNMFPIAWAVCEAESKETWTWFLQNLMNDIATDEP